MTPEAGGRLELRATTTTSSSSKRRRRRVPAPAARAADRGRTMGACAGAARRRAPGARAAGPM